jgi:hypothetical protein
MAQAVSRWLLTAEAWVRARVNRRGICGGQSGTGQVFSEYFGFPCNIIPPLLHIHLSPPHEVCDCSDQAAHYHNLGPQLRASLLPRHIGWKQEKKERKKERKKKVRLQKMPEVLPLIRLILRMRHFQSFVFLQAAVEKCEWFIPERIKFSKPN